MGAFWVRGTSVAGLIAAEGNNGYGMIGIAPGTRIAGWVICDSVGFLVDRNRLATVFPFHLDEVDVQCHSWNLPAEYLLGPLDQEAEGIARAIEAGRRGRGDVMVYAGGDGRLSGHNDNDNGYVNDPRAIAVAAVGEDGRAIQTSNPGACLLVAAPALDLAQNGLFTLDLLERRGVNFINYFPPHEALWNFRFNSLGFSGTPAATALISGIVALVLAAHPDLSYRDVQQILLLSSRHFDREDPDLVENSAGLRVSHHVGFGVPDAGQAVVLARCWPRRPALQTLTLVQSGNRSVPDDALRLLVSGEGVPVELQSIRTAPSLGPHPDDPTDWLPLLSVGFAAAPVPLDLTGKAALIERGETNYLAKIRHVANAGAAFAVIFNLPESGVSNDCPGGDYLCPLGGTEFAPIPAVSIARTSGESLIHLIQTNLSVKVRLCLFATNATFTVTNTWSCEHVGVRVRAEHPVRGDQRITLLSPGGTRSILQRFNTDLNPGPVDWTYWSTHQFYESSAGVWTISFSDELQQNEGAITEVSLIIRGTAIQDQDADGLDDQWEYAHFQSLAGGPKDDPDDDGYSNLREAISGTDPNGMEPPLVIGISQLNPARVRLCWPSIPKRRYEVWGGPDVRHLESLAALVGDWPVTEWIISTDSNNNFFQVRSP